jgi:hypothetical protein
MDYFALEKGPPSNQEAKYRSHLIMEQQERSLSQNIRAKVVDGWLNRVEYALASSGKNSNQAK